MEDQASIGSQQHALSMSADNLSCSWGGGLILLGWLALGLGGCGSGGLSWLGLFGLWCLTSLGWFSAIRRCPKGEVITEELHDEGAVPVRLLGQRVELGNGIVECLLGKMASAVG
jgi:hypothetical protein